MKYMTSTLALATLLACACPDQPLSASPVATQIVSDQAPASPAYSQGVRTGNFVFVAGQIGMDAKGVLVGPTIEEQTAQALKNIEVILAEEGLTLNDVVKTQIFLKDAKDFAVVNGLYMQAFTGQLKPVRTTVITNLPKDALIEIECTAFTPKQN